VVLSCGSAKKKGSPKPRTVMTQPFLQSLVLEVTKGTLHTYSSCWLQLVGAGVGLVMSSPAIENLATADSFSRLRGF
jgi:hypothetical protein